MSATNLLPLDLSFDEVTSLPQVDSAEDVRNASHSCFCEILAADLEAGIRRGPGHLHVIFGERAAPPWFDQDVRFEAVHLFKIVNAFFFPKFGVVIDDKGAVMRLTMEEARYLTPDLLKLPFVEKAEQGSALRVENKIEKISKGAITMPWGSTNYGHFLLDCLPAAATISSMPCFEDYPILTPALLPWQKRHWELLGIRPVQLSNDIYHMKELVYTSGMHHFLQSPNINYKDVSCQQLGRTCLQNDPTHRRLYLSRGDKPNRLLASESELRAKLLDVGFTSIDTATMRVDDQISAFRTADIVVGCSGAAFANVLYCRPGTVILEITPQGMDSLWVRKLAFIAECRFVSYLCNAMAAHPTNPEIYLRFDLNVSRFMECLEPYLQAKRSTEMSRNATKLPSIKGHAGLDYGSVLFNLHKNFNPRSYLEIGTLNGSTLNIAKCKSIAVDPEFRIATNIIGDKPACFFFQCGSDQFFRENNPSAILGQHIDLAYLDGLHFCEFLLRDFINTEKHCNRNSVIVLHDCIPPDLYVARRESHDTTLQDLSQFHGWWAGDVWKTVVALRYHRPDLRIYFFDAPPTGLVCITNLDRDSTLLSDDYFKIVEIMSNKEDDAEDFAKYLASIDIRSTKELESFSSISSRFWL